MNLYDLGEYIELEFDYGTSMKHDIIRKKDIIKVWIELPDEEKLMIDTILSNGKDYTIQIKDNPQNVVLNFYNIQRFLVTK